jgi:AraC-like DNA-binding protein
MRDEDSDFTFMYSINDNYDSHFHSNLEIVYVLEGEIEVGVNNFTALLTSGCVSIANSYDVHRYRTPSHSKSITLIIPTDMINSFLVLSQSLTFKTPFMMKGCRSQAILDTIFKLEEFNTINNSIIVKGYLYVILGLLVEQLGLEQRSKSSVSIGPIREILFYLEKNYLNDINISNLAKRFGYNKDYLSRLFNSTLGCGFMRYINVLRARHAAQLIRNTNINISDIAYQSGFNNLRTFDRAFKYLYKVTPLTYKKNLLTQD